MASRKGSTYGSLQEVPRVQTKKSKDTRIPRVFQASSTSARKINQGKKEARALGMRVSQHLLGGGSSRDIPFLLPGIDKKSQIVEVRLVTDYISVTTVNATAYTTVQAFAFSTFSNSADLKNVFDEVRPIRGKVYYIPRYIYGGNSAGAAIMEVGGAAIDFANASAFGSSASMLQHDNHVMFTLLQVTQPATARRRFDLCSAEWDILFDGSPDKNWQDASASTNVAWWKPYFNPGDVTAGVTVGYLVAEMDFQFRGMK